MGRESVASVLAAPSLQLMADEIRYLKHLEKNPQETGTFIGELEKWRLAGNRHFNKKDFESAIHIYKRCARLGRGFESITTEEFRGRATPIVIMADSNCAQAYLERRQWESALQSAEGALSLGPQHVKSLFRKGKALQGLQEFKKALAALEAALELRPYDDSTMAAVAEVKSAYHQSVTGEFDLYNYYLENLPPFCSDYVGSVEIKSTATAGRGLFLTESMKLGQLVIVSNAIALGLAARGKFNEHLINLAFACTRLATSSVRYAHQFRYFHSRLKNQNARVPPLELYIPGSDWAPDPHSKVEPPGIEEALEIVRINSFDSSRIGNPEAFLDGLKDALGHTPPAQVNVCALWALPSLLNHSCLPTCAVSLVGKAMFIRATRDLPAGTELTISYVVSDSLDREQLTKAWNFACRCERCLFDEIVKPHISDAVQMFSDIMSDFEARLPRALEPDKLKYEIFSRLIHHVEQRIQNLPCKLDDRQKGWVRFIFQRGYMLRIVFCPQEVSRLEKIEMVAQLLNIYKAVEAGTCGLNLQLAACLLKGVELEYGRSSHEYQSTRKVVAMHFHVALGEMDDDFLDKLLKAKFSSDSLAPFFNEVN